MPTNLQAAETEAVGLRTLGMAGICRARDWDGWSSCFWSRSTPSWRWRWVGSIRSFCDRCRNGTRLRWDPGPFGEVFSGLFGGQTGLIALRTVVYVVIGVA